MHDRALSDAVALIALGTANTTLAVGLLSWRNPAERLSWNLRGADLEDGRLARLLTGLGVVAAIWGGLGLQDWVPTPLAVVTALGPALARLVVWWRHNRRLTASHSAHPHASPTQR